MAQEKRSKRSVLHRNRKEQLENAVQDQAKATAKYLRLSPRKARSIVNAIRGQKVDKAFEILEFSPRKAARIVQKILKSAVANAENNFDLETEHLVVSEAYVNDGPRMKRVWPRGRGRADILMKRMSHITVVVKDTSKNLAG
ncbi:MAG TPA: 50S ribosomal protein L22 [Thermotogota bacterium]|nr:50S ribosomal protein L22 [Thermotogota bacterium]HRW91371.1 50S ribosomal protein L22 [Thermotogota bacterium]